MAISGTLTATDTMTMSRADVAVDIGAAASFADIETWATSITVTGGEVPTSQETSLGGTKIIAYGEAAPYTITVTCFYTEGANDPFSNIWAVQEAGTDSREMEVKWAQAGATTGDMTFTTSGGRLTNCTLPTFTNTESQRVKFSFTVVAPTVADATL